MKKGEISIITCSSEYGFGERGSSPNIPPNSQLKLEIELMGWKGEEVTEDGEVTKIILQTGQGYQTPNYGADITGKWHISFSNTGLIDGVLS